MDAALIKSWNDTVRPEDTIFFLGDLSFHWELYKDRLNGNIVWVKGNHDKEGIIDSIHVTYGGLEWQLIHDPMQAEPSSKLVLCGHLHQKWQVMTAGDQLFINVGVDVWDFKPVSFDQLLARMKDVKEAMGNKK